MKPMRHALLALGLLLIVTPLALAANRPNVIILLTDDQGYGELSCHGNPILETPQLDRVYAESVRLTDFHVAPMCTPTRGQLLSGIDAARNGAINVSSGRTLLRAELPTMANFFANAGYRTGIFGKWHVGDNFPYRPEDRGFEETLWFPSSHVSAVPDAWENDYFNDTYTRNGQRQACEGYCTDLFFRTAIEWMKQQAAQNQPFFTYLPTNAPHGPLWVPESYRLQMEAHFDKTDAKVPPGVRQALVRYLAMIRNIDDNVGRLLEFLDEAKVADNTILIFATDNGSTFGHRYYNAGMRGHKTELWEGGHRVPCFIRWPGGNLGAPRDVDGLTQVQDLLPTLVDLCDLQPAKSTRFDGISLAGALQRQEPVPSDRMLVINYSRMPIEFDYPSPDSPSIMRREGAAVLWQRWRLLEDNQLYDLASDPLQQTNVIEQHPEIAAKLRAHLDQWWSDVDEMANEPQPVTIGSEHENPTMLTACEWLDVFVDQQAQVRRGVYKNGFWNLKVEQPGEYEFELRRWPREAGLTLTASLPETKVTDGTLVAGQSLPIAGARLLVGGQRRTKELSSNAEAATFRVRLEPGATRLYTWFDDQDARPICGAYYVYVRRL